jgi:cysteine desulfurase
VIDLDHNASTALDPRVREAMLEAMELGNPSSSHARGRAARSRLDQARRQVAACLGCEPGEIVFTSSGSEGNALGLKGSYFARRKLSTRVLLSAVEHPSMRESVSQLQAIGAEPVELPVDSKGVVKLEAVERELAGGAAVIAVMAVNNETGVIQPFGQVHALAVKAQVPLLVDAVQLPGKRALALPGELLTLSGHKFHGPQGSGVLVVRRGVTLSPLLGGHQERGRRGGTENVAGAAGLATALTLCPDDGEQRRIETLRDRFERELCAALPGCEVHGAGALRVGNTSAVHFPGVDGEALLIALDLAGVCVSLGAACSSGALSPSHVLLAMGCSERQARSSLRFSFGRENTNAEVTRVVALLLELVPRARR